MITIEEFAKTDKRRLKGEIKTPKFILKIQRRGKE